MFASRLFVVTAVLAACLLAACGGPTKTGLEARANARSRLNIVNAQLQYDQATQSFEVGRFERAEREIAAAIGLDSENADYVVLQGRIYLETHRLEQAIRSFLSAIELDEENHRAHYYAGIVFQRWSDDEQAFEHYLAASEIDTANVQYLLAAAEALVAMGELDAARILIEDQLIHFEHNAALHHLLGQISLLEGDTEQAVEQYTEARILDPEDLFVLEDLVRVQFRAQQYGKCLQSLAELQMRIDEPRLDLRMLEARCLALVGRTSNARDLYMKLSQEHPSDADVWIELGTIAWEMGDFHRVAQCSVRALSLAPDRYEGHMLRGSNERHHGNFDQAVAELRRAVSLAPDIVMPRLLLGMTLEEQGDAHAALAAYEQAMSIDPESREARMLRDRLMSADDRLSSVPSDP